MARKFVFNPFTGKFDIIDVSASSGGSTVPFFVDSGETATFDDEHAQYLWTIPIELEDETSNLDIAGVLVEVQ